VLHAWLTSQARLHLVSPEFPDVVDPLRILRFAPADQFDLFAGLRCEVAEGAVADPEFSRSSSR